MLFANSNKCYWKAASRVIKSSSDPTKQNTIVWLAYLNCATTYCCQKHPVCLIILSLQISLDNIDCHCLLMKIYYFFSLVLLKKNVLFYPTITVNLFKLTGINSYSLKNYLIFSITRKSFPWKELIMGNEKFPIRYEIIPRACYFII